FTLSQFHIYNAFNCVWTSELHANSNVILGWNEDVLGDNEAEIPQRHRSMPVEAGLRQRAEYEMGMLASMASTFLPIVLRIITSFPPSTAIQVFINVSFGLQFEDMPTIWNLLQVQGCLKG
ncbi:hypothetical protein M8C21_015423, partial [Ambrosia artemisiifolia]